MPAEPLTVMLRASNFFEKNPGLWVPPTSLDKDKTSKDLNKCCGGGNKQVGLVDRSGAAPRL
jgi:primary-amine oxidase